MSMPGMSGGNSGAGGGSAGAGVALVMLASAIAIFAGGDAQRVLLTAVLTMMMYAVISFSPIVGFPMMVTYLAFVGIFRRYAIPLFGYTTMDPLLLVGPSVVGIFFANKLIARALPHDTTLSKGMIAILVIMAIQAMNPIQGGVAIGLSGVLFFMMPMLWYYCGRDFGTPKVNEAVLRSVLALAVLGAAYGMYQQFYGLSAVEQQWIALTNNDKGQYISNGVMRVFSIFSSFAEYVKFTCLGLVVGVALAIKRNKFALFPCLFLLGALALSSSRGGLLTGIFGCVVIWAVQGKTYASWIPRIALALAVGGAALYFGLSQVKDTGKFVENDTAETLLEHQARGILNPFDQKKSTGGSHVMQFFQAIQWSFESPLGLGLGATTVGASKFGGGVAGVESDIGNMFISAGFIGGFIFMGFVGYVCWRLALSWYKRRDYVSLAALGLLISSLGMWTGIAQYATTMLCWFLIGAIDRMDAAEMAAKQEAKVSPATADTGTPRPELKERRLPA